MQREIHDLWTSLVLPETLPFRRDGDELSDRLRALESQGFVLADKISYVAGHSLGE